MTKEEIIETLEHNKGLYSFNPMTGEEEPIDEDCRKSAEALDFVIKFLKQEQSEDCIARQPLIENWYSCADMLMAEGDSQIVMEWILDAPTVTPTRKVGKWIKIAETDEIVCKACNCSAVFKSRFCPNCGTEMEK